VEPEITVLGETSRECSHFGEAVIPSATVEPGLATEIHTCEGGGMPLEGWVTTAHEAQHFGTSEESSAWQTSFTKLSAEAVLENENENGLTDVSAISDRDDEVLMGAVIPHSLSLAEDFNRVQEDGDVESLEELHDKIEGIKVLPDVRLDHPTSTSEVQYDDEDNSYFRYTTGLGSVEPNEDFEKSDSYFQHTAGPGSVEPDEDHGESDIDKTDREGSVDFEKSDKGEEVLHGETQTALSQNEFENVSNGIFDTEEWSRERQRPTRATRRSTCLRDS